METLRWLSNFPLDADFGRCGDRDDVAPPLPTDPPAGRRKHLDQDSDGNTIAADRPSKYDAVGKYVSFSVAGSNLDPAEAAFQNCLLTSMAKVATAPLSGFAITSTNLS